jgi:hypothetical protein
MAIAAHWILAMKPSAVPIMDSFLKLEFGSWDSIKPQYGMRLNLGWHALGGGGL